MAADPRHHGARIGLTAVLHTWGSAMTHHPHVLMIVPGGGLSADGSRWIACRPGFFLSVRVLSRLFRRLFLGVLAAAHAEGRLAFFSNRKTMTLATHEFIRRFLMHVLPKGFQRIRHNGLLANGNRAAMIAKAPSTARHDATRERTRR